MADESILTVGVEEDDETTDSETTETYLVRDNYLSEYESDTDKDIVRQNLKVPYIDNVYNKDETDIKILEQINSALEVHLNAEDPHGTEASIKEELNNNYVRTDGTTPFTATQKGVDPEEDEDLVTKAYADDLVKDLLTEDDKQDILDEVEETLSSYVKSSEIYDKDSSYSSTEVDNLLKEYVRADGTVPFTKSQIGIDPTLDSHLATKRYADKILYKHLIEVDPHNFITTLNNRLAAYAKLKDVYTKTQTYSRSQIYSLISEAVDEQLDAAVEAYKEIVDELEESLSEYVKKDGSTSFTSAQKGVEATEDNELVTLSQVNTLVTNLDEELSEAIENKECVWVTSGPVESTVGHVLDNSELSNEMTLQQVMDAIFYGNTVSISADDYVTIGTTTTITLCVHGSTANIESAELYQGDELIGTYVGDDFEDGCIEVESEEVMEETEFKFIVTYSNDVTNEQSITVGVSYPCFIGLLPKWKTASTITTDYLNELVNEDSTNNQYIDYNGDGSSVTFTYDFEDAELVHIFIVVPQSYPDLESITTSAQEFGIDAFDVVEELTLEIESTGETEIYKVYVYSQAISSLHQDVTFNFVSDEDSDDKEDEDTEDETEEEEV